MKISVICPTHRTKLSSYSRICELLSLDPKRFEVIIRDNSECVKKRLFLESIDSKEHKIHSVKNNGAIENYSQASKLATGDFLFFIADDDWIFKSGLEMLYEMAVSMRENKTLTALTGTYLVSSSRGTGSIAYKGLDSSNSLARMQGYLGVGPCLLFYSAYKKNVFQLSWSLIEKLPYAFCHGDLLFVIPAIVIGNIFTINNICYQWDFGEWERADKAMGKRAAFCEAAGLPKEFSVLDKLLTAIEGALLINSKLLGNYVRYDRSEMASLWLKNFFVQYQGCPFQNYFPDSEEKNRVDQFRIKLFSIGNITLEGLLEEVTRLFAQVDPIGAEKYFKFWSKI